MVKQNKKLWQWLVVFQVVVQKASHLFSASLLKYQVVSLGCIHHMHVCFDYFLIFICMHTDFKPQYVDNFHKYRCLASKAHECVLLVLIFWFCHLHYVHPEHQFE